MIYAQSPNMLTLTPEQLAEVLKKYSGRELDLPALPYYKRSSMQFFGDLNQVPDPRIEITQQLDITHLYNTYTAHYKSTPDATFTAYVKWNLLKATQDSVFKWRYINHKWYEFDNLPLEVTARVENNELITCMLENVNYLDWEAFCVKHADVKRGKVKNLFEEPTPPPVWGLAQEIVGVHISRMTSYKATRKTQYSHHTWFVFSDRYISENKLWMPLHVSFSHAIITPKMMEDLLAKFQFLAESPKFKAKL